MGARRVGGVRWVEIDACIRTLDPDELRSVVLDLVAPLADEFERASAGAFCRRLGMIMRGYRRRTLAGTTIAAFMADSAAY